MPYFHCSRCDHEWEGRKEDITCNWCGAENAYTLEDQTPVEKLCAFLVGEPEGFFIDLDKKTEG